MAAAPGPSSPTRAAGRAGARPVARPRRRGPPTRSPWSCPATTRPHDRLTEWWYYTGHLRGGRRPPVRLRVRRSSAPSAAASRSPGHRTSRSPTRRATGSTTTSGRRSGRRWTARPRTARAARPGFALAVSGFDLRRSAMRCRWATPWTMTRRRRRGRADRGGRGAEVPATRWRPSGSTSRSTRGQAAGAPRHATATIDFGPAGGSYYYSRTAMDADGHGHPRRPRRCAVTGDAWFDHQWGDFISVGGGGWDWFAVNLDDGTDLTLSLVRAADGTLPAGLRDARRRRTGATRHLARGRLHAWRSPTTWTSPATGADVPGRLARHDAGRGARDRPRAHRRRSRSWTRGRPPGVVYWEGSQRVAATRAAGGGPRLPADRVGAGALTAAELPRPAGDQAGPSPTRPQAKA